MVGSRPNSLSTATGLGPRATVVTSERAASSRARSTCRSTSASRCRTPTPVMKITISIWPVITRLAKSMAGRFSAIGTSRIEGLTWGTPPARSISRAISVARRLSNAETCKPANPASWSLIPDYVTCQRGSATSERRRENAVGGRRRRRRGLFGGTSAQKKVCPGELIPPGQTGASGELKGDVSRGAQPCWRRRSDACPGSKPTDRQPGQEASERHPARPGWQPGCW